MNEWEKLYREYIDSITKNDIENKLRKALEIRKMQDPEKYAEEETEILDTIKRDGFNI